MFIQISWWKICLAHFFPLSLTTLPSRLIRHLMCGPSKRIVRKEAQYRTHQVPALLYKARKVIPQTELSISLKRPFLSKKTISCYILPLCFSLFSSFFTLFCFQHNWLKGSIIWYVNYKFYYTHSYKCTSGLVVE